VPNPLLLTGPVNRGGYDLFGEVSHELRQLWEANPDLTGLDLFDALCRIHPGQFHNGQVRKLQRRLRKWRAELTRRLVFGAVADHLPPAAGDICTEAIR
jgi:hypothetical protein